MLSFMECILYIFGFDLVRVCKQSKKNLEFPFGFFLMLWDAVMHINFYEENWNGQWKKEKGKLL